MHELRTQHVSIGSSVRSKQLLYFVQVKAKTENKNVQQNTLSSFITFPAFNYGGMQ